MDSFSLLDVLARRAGCDLLSDLRRPEYWMQLRAEIGKIPAADFPLAEWNDTAHYLDRQSKPFSSAGEARAHLLQFLEQVQ